MQIRYDLCARNNLSIDIEVVEEVAKIGKTIRFHSFLSEPYYILGPIDGNVMSFNPMAFVVHCAFLEWKVVHTNARALM